MIGLVIDYTPREVDIYVVIGNGRLDAGLMALLLHALNHRSVAGMIKPKEVGSEATVRSLVTLLEKSVRKSVKSVIILDQNTKKPSEAIDEVRKYLREHGF